MKRRVITVDGPSGVGKGTLCQRLARELDWAYLDSGLIYRIAAVLLNELKLAPNSANALQLLKQLTWQNTQGTIHVRAGEHNKIYDEDHLRSEESAALASEIAALPEVRQALLQAQRQFALPRPLIADGRDMGTLVFPDAILKIFLTAEPTTRAQRRLKQLKDKGRRVSLSALSAHLNARDQRDTQRRTAPLSAAADAIIIATDTLTVDEVFDRVFRLAQEHLF